MKICTKCKKSQDLKEFSPDKRHTDGKASHCRTCNKKYCRVRHNNNPEIARSYKLKQNFNISISDYNLMLKEQDNKCGICFKPEITIDNRTNKVKRLAVDHCHKTGKVRGLLCSNCNIGIGKFKENILNLESAIAYLREDKGLPCFYD